MRKRRRVYRHKRLSRQLARAKDPPDETLRSGLSGTV